MSANWKALHREIAELEARIRELQNAGHLPYPNEFVLDTGRANGAVYYRKRKRNEDGTPGYLMETLNKEAWGELREMQQRGKEIHRLQKRIAALVKKADAIATTAKRLGLQLPNIQHSSDSNEWYTLAEWVERARRVMGGIDLDPASNHEAQGWIQAATYYTQEQDGMVQPWKGRMWLNPPYGQRKAKPVRIYGASAWIERAIAEYKAGNVPQAVLWLRASGNSGIQALEAKRFPRVVLGRVNHAPAGANGEPQKGVGHDTVVYYLGPNSGAFYREFMGVVASGDVGDRQRFV